MKVILYGTVTNGKIILDSQYALDKFKEAHEGKRVELTFTKLKKNRSNEQNRYYWGAVIPIIKTALREAGNEFSSEQVHDLLKFKFLREDLRVNESTGEVLERIKSSTELSTSEFMEFIAQVQRWSADFLNIVIPDPNEQLTIEA